MATRFFSLREANALLSTLQEEFTRARQLRDDLMGVQQKLQEAGHAIDGPDVQIDPEAPVAVQRLQGRAVQIIGKLRDILRDVAELGVEVTSWTPASPGAVLCRRTATSSAICSSSRCGYALDCTYLRAISSISTRAPLGSAATCTVLRAGGLRGKRLP